MIQIYTNNNIESLDDTHTKFKEIVQITIQLRNLSEEQKKMILDYLRNEKPNVYKMETREGPRSLMIELSFEKTFSIQKKDFSSILELSSSSEQKKSLKKITKLFHDNFKTMKSVREKQMVSKLYKMYLKELKNETIGKTRSDFKQFLRNILGN